MSRFEDLKNAAMSRGLLPGMCIETSLLGRVPYVPDGKGDYKALISEDLQREALKNGFLIEAADFKAGQYTLRLLAKPKAAARSSSPLG